MLKINQRLGATSHFATLSSGMKRGRGRVESESYSEEDPEEVRDLGGDEGGERSGMYEESEEPEIFRDLGGGGVEGGRIGGIEDVGGLGEGFGEDMMKI